MQLVERLLTYSIWAYLAYIFLFSFLIFLFHPLKNQKGESFSPTEDSNLLQNQDRVALIESKEDAISVRLDLIEHAESQIDLAYYRWSEGKVSDLMLGSLLEAADRGVEVRILLDGLVQITNTGQPINEVFKAFKTHPNIDLRVYEAFNPLLPIAWNHRMHDKMILVDQKLALTGGRNIQDRFYLDDLDQKDLVKDREVLVYHADATGSTAITDMAHYYNQLWDYDYTQEKDSTLSFKENEKAKASLMSLRESHPNNKKKFLAEYFPDLENKDWVAETVPTNHVSFVSNNFGRLNQNPRALQTILTLAEETEESIFIQSPYFIPSRRMLNEVNDFQIDPAQTTLFTNSEAASPNLAAIAAYHLRRPKLIESGARIVEYQGPGSSHAKSSIFDERISVVGTFNIDPRSAYLNTESMVIIDSEDFAEELKGAIAEDFEHSLVVDSDGDYLPDPEQEPARISFTKKMMIRLLSLLTPFFEHLL